jgi:poly(hydroxyalkanoate) depolymerase family esterase
MTRSWKHVAALLATGAGLLVASPARAAWQNTYAFGATLKGDLYTPATLASPPAILVAIHMCTGHSSTVHGWFDQYADKNGFYIIAPDAGKQCFDASATRDGDKAAIVTMVNYLITQKGADKNRVFAAGMSSGGCMTNTLLAIYPDVFAGGSAMPGFPAGGWPAGDITCTKCGSNPPSTDGKYWGDIARKAFAWTGTYPCSQQWVGGGDEYKFNAWLPAVAAQFQNLSTLGSGMAGTGAPNGWTRTVYKNAAGNVRLETNLGPSSQMHDLETVNPPLYGPVITFLGLDKPTGACGLTGGTGTDGGSPDSGRTDGAASGSGGSMTSGSGGSMTSGSGGTTTAGSGGTTTAGSGGTTVSGTGGASHGTGGSVVTAGTGGAPETGTGGSGGSNLADSSCAVAGTPGTRGGAVASIALVALALTLARRRRR